MLARRPMRSWRSDSQARSLSCGPMPRKRIRWLITSSLPVLEWAAQRRAQVIQNCFADELDPHSTRFPRLRNPGRITIMKEKSVKLYFMFWESGGSFFHFSEKKLMEGWTG